MNNKARGFFEERPLAKFEVDPQVLRRRTRRDVLLFGLGRGQRWRVLDPCCRKIRSPVWACVEIWTLPGRSGC
jgi:hypothetical protein